jgi:hypothetical protein
VLVVRARGSPPSVGTTYALKTPEALLETSSFEPSGENEAPAKATVLKKSSGA